MRILRTRLKDIGPFSDFTLNVSDVEGTVVAIKAPNGSGKTCALEMAWLGTCYRDTATQGSLIERATSRDSFVESDVEAEDGKVYTIRHEVDAVARKGESVVVRQGETEPLWKGTKVSAFAEWAERHLLPRDVLTSTVFAVQGANGFIGLGSAARISVILKAVGVARVERMAELARAGRKRIEGDLQTSRLRVSDARAALPDVDKLTRSREEIEGRIERGAEQLARVQTDLDAAKAMATDSALARARYREQVEARNGVVARRDALVAELADLRGQLENLDLGQAQRDVAQWEARAKESAATLERVKIEAADIERRQQVARQLRIDRQRLTDELARAQARTAATSKLVANNQYVLDHAEELRAALAKAESLRQRIQELELSAVGAKADLERHGADVARYDADRVLNNEAAAEAERRIDRATRALLERDQVEAAVSSIETRKASLTAALESEAECKRELEELRSRTLVDAEGRIRGLRGGLIAVTDLDPKLPAEAAAALALVTLEADDSLVAEAAELPGMIAVAADELQTWSEFVAKLREECARIGELGAKLPAIQAAEEELASATSERNRAQSAAADAESLAASSDTARKAAAIRLQDAGTGIDSAHRDQVALEPLLKRAAALATAESRLAELRPQLALEQADETRILTELGALPEAEVVPIAPDIERYRNAAAGDAQQARAYAEQAVRVATSIDRLRPQLAGVEAELSGTEAKLAAMPEPVPPGEDPDLSSLEGALLSERDAYDEALREYSATETLIAQAIEQQARVDALELETRTLEAELSDWTRLALDLGRDGIQSAEVDSAGPELTTLTNDLLLNCHGPRYSVSIETSRTKANGKGATDECRVMVRDTEDGSEREARLHSGGECVVLGEAVSLALTMMACQRSGVRGAYLVRDESGAALDPQNARVYLDMLRHAARVTNAGKVLFVSHSEDVQRMADSVIEIRRSA